MRILCTKHALCNVCYQLYNIVPNTSIAINSTYNCHNMQSNLMTFIRLSNHPSRSPHLLNARQTSDQCWKSYLGGTQSGLLDERLSDPLAGPEEFAEARRQLATEEVDPIAKQQPLVGRQRCHRRIRVTDGYGSDGYGSQTDTGQMDTGHRRRYGSRTEIPVTVSACDQYARYPGRLLWRL